MHSQGFDVHSWVEMLETAGLDEAGRHRWHAEFERRFPQQHQGFLEWLGLAKANIEEVRDQSRTAWRN